ncbi:MAG: hypothetical protein AAFR35_09915 [Pseudomonadota bacterium]
MADNDQNGDDSGGTPAPAPAPAPADPFQGLKDDLTALEGEKATYEAKTIEANITELKKLIDDGKKALDPYKAAHPTLLQEQNRLENFKARMAPDLLANCLPDTAKADIEATVAAAISDIDAAEAEVVRLKGKIPSGDTSTSDDPWIRGAVDVARNALAGAEETFEAAKVKLENLKSLAKTVETRLKAVKGYEAEITKLATGGKPATAYWLLTQGSAQDAAGHTVIDGSAFFTGQLTGDPVIIDPSRLVSDLTAAWTAFKTARADVAAKTSALKTVEDELTAAEKALGDLKKDLVKTIRATLEAYDENRVKSAA